MSQEAEVKRRAARRWLFRSIVFCGASVVSLALAEISLRVAGYPAFSAIDPTEQLLVLDKRLGWRNRPSAELTWGYIDPAPSISIGSEGYRRGIGWPSGIDPQVVCIGDSTTFCAEVSDSDTWPSRLALALGGDVCVLNAGVRGYNTLQSARMLDQCLDRFPSIQVAVYTYCPNDLDENVTPHSHPPLVAPVAHLDAEGTFVETEPTNPVVAWGEQPPGTPKASARLLNPLRRRSVLLNQGSLFVTNPRTHVINRNTPAALAPGEPRVAVLETLLARMKTACERRGAKLVVTSFTTGDPPNPFLMEACERLVVPFVDASDQFEADQLTYHPRTAQGGHDAHFGPRGTRVFAAALARAVRAELR